MTAGLESRFKQTAYFATMLKSLGI